MIIRDKLGPLQLMFALRGSVLPHIAAPVATPLQPINFRLD